MVVGVAVVVVAIVVVLAVVSLGGMISTTVGTAFRWHKRPEKMSPLLSASTAHIHCGRNGLFGAT